MRSVPPEAWVTIPVPALVSEALFAAAQEQLAENQRRARRSPHGARYLLQGLLVCARCGYAYYGKTLTLGGGTPTPRQQVYYRCSGTDSYRFGGTAICDNAQLRGDQVEAAVWQGVADLGMDNVLVMSQKKPTDRVEQAKAHFSRGLRVEDAKYFETSELISAMGPVGRFGPFRSFLASGPPSVDSTEQGRATDRS